MLRSNAEFIDDSIGAWEQELSRSGTLIDQWRQNYLTELLPFLRDQALLLVPELGAVELRYRRGWSEHEALGDVLVLQRKRDQARGHTGSGAHRADWSLSFEGAPQREHLSRGQEKLVALVCILAQAKLDAWHRAEWPIVCLDDLASELDHEHELSVIESLSSTPAQILVTGTEVPRALQQTTAQVFHVEQGKLAPLL